MIKAHNLERVIYPVLSFVIPAIIILAALAGLKVTPFGDNSLAISDGNGLYINYMGYVSGVLKGEQGILYSFTKGLGGNMMGSWGWFLLNPLFALFALADVTGYMLVYTFVSMFSFCLCGLTMYIMLSDFYGHRADNLIFSTAYAMNGFLVANVFQLNFFVAIPVLPIMVMGLRRILKGGSPVIYTISIAYCLMMNFYFGFMICVASLLIFVVCFAVYRDSIANKKAVAIKYTIASLLGGMLSAFVWLPALLSLRGGRLDQSIAGTISFSENMPFLDMFSKLFIGANSTSELSNGLPNIFVGIIPVFLVIMFFVSGRISKQKKTVAALLLTFYLLSFYIVVFNIAMHGGTVTNWFNYRDSFVFCFLMLLVAAEEWNHITDEPEGAAKRAIIILVVATLVVFNKSFDYVSGGMVLLDFAILAALLFAFYMHKKNPEKNPRKVFTSFALVLMCLNLYLNYYFSVKNIMDWTYHTQEYKDITLCVGALVDGIKASDDSFYRMEVGEQRSLTLGNDPMLYGYYGVGHGGSDDRDFVRLALSELGVHRFNMRNNYGKGVPAATDALLGLKYIISKRDLTQEKNYEKLAGIGDYNIYGNPCVLPIGMVVDADVEGVTIDLEDVFDNLNRTWSAMTGIDEKVFIEEENVVFSSHNMTDPISLSGQEAVKIVSERDASIEAEESDKTSSESSVSGSGSISEEGAQSDGEEEWETSEEKPENTNYIMLTFTARYDGAVYSYNRSGMTEDNGAYPHALNYEGTFHKGDVVTRYLPVDNSLVTQYLLEEVAGRFKVAYADDDVLATMSSAVLERPSSIMKMSDSHLTGSFTAGENQKLMFTIPYDEGWSLYVDGQKTELKKVLDVFMLADVNPGEHTYEMKFVPEGLKSGSVLSLIGLLMSLLLLLISVISIGRRW